MDENYLVTKSNYFIMNSSYDLSLEEQKIILTLASMVQPEDEEFKAYKFSIKEFSELLGVENKSKYTKIPKITKELMKKVFEIQEGKTLIQTAWLSGVKYEKGSGCVELTFSSYLKPYMLKLKEKFTQYQLTNVLSMKSKYSPRIYEILKCNEFKKQGFVNITVEELRKLTKAENIYPLYADFKRKIILQAQKELKQKSDIYFDFEEIKTRRKVTEIKFYIHSNKKITSNDEMAATKSPVKQITGQIDFETQELINKVKQIIKEPLTEKNIYDLLKVAENDINKIQIAYKVAEKSKTPIGNLPGFLTDAIKNNYTPSVGKENVKKSKFANFKEREDWDFDKIEKLGRKQISKEL